MANEYTFGQKLQGIGAALSGTIPQFQQEMQQLSEARTKAMYQDAGAAYQMLQGNNYQGIIDLANDRLSILRRLPGSDPSDTQRVLQLAQNAMAGDTNSREQLQQTLGNAYQRGIDLGILARPDAPERITVGEGQIVYERNPITGEFRQVVSGGEKKQSRTPTTELGKLRSDLDSGAITQTQYDEQVALINKREDRATF
ncbi:MAG: hypothetical protein EBS81_12515, partial [Gammaproteobacteria bacterium]|nr:hypothetical protein [Gammaproteobacteria bacterium]